MALLLLESKRDDLLLPYFELVKAKNPNLTFGQFKSNLLEHLTQNGGLRNLSLASNYYLAGAARYYFNGDLTSNKNLALYYPYTPNSQLEAAVNNGEEVVQNHIDKWKPDVCKALNKVILLLRNSYIDTMGETWEQPEDFGNIPLAKLIKKYNSKISKLKSVDPEDDYNKLNISDRVSKNYTFEIMYSHEDCKKFYEATSPGAWCITYGQGHYDRYISMLNIHYVIFKRDGWENVPRVPEKEKWVNDNNMLKPQDDYGNSLIALLQSNKNGEPIYITSRWNHGSSDCGSVEADHAYTKEEFMRITGVTNDELKRIFEIWAKNTKNRAKTNAEISESLKLTIRRLKEFQMRINGGADIVDYMEKFGIGIHRTLFEDADSFSPIMLKKTAFVLKISDNDGTMYFFIMDKGKVIFESLCDSSKLYKNIKTFIIPTDFKNETARLENSIIIPNEKYFMIYNYRFHSFLNVRGDTKFKRVPTPDNDDIYNYPKTGKSTFFEVKKGKVDIALINLQTFKPLVLPNGDIWFNEISYAKRTFDYEPQNKIFCHFCGELHTPVFEITYDMSSGEKYFYNSLQKRFFEPKEDNDFTPKLSSERLGVVPVLVRGGWTSNGNKGFYGIRYKIDKHWGGYDSTTPTIFYDALTDVPVEINGLHHFDDMEETLDCEEPIYKLRFTETLTKYNPSDLMKRKIEFFKSVFKFDGNNVIVYDKTINKPLAINGNLVDFYDMRANNNFIILNLRYRSELVPEIEDLKYSKCISIYDTKKHAFIKNPSGFPNDKIFAFDYIDSWGDYENGIIGYYYPNDETINSEEKFEINAYTSVRKGCLELNINDLTYYPIEFNDRTDEYLRLFGNENEMADNQEIIQEDIKRMVERIVKNILNEKRMAN